MTFQSHNAGHIVPSLQPSYRGLTRFLLGSSLLMCPTISLAQSSDNLSNVAADEIIVTGSPLVRSVDEAISGVSVLTGDELADRLASTIGETLKSEPGISSTAFGAGASRPIIRGQGGDRVRVLNNGVGSIDASSASPDHAVATEPAQAERIEVLRGASLLRYGSSGSGGIVNVLDGRIPDSLPEDGFDGAFRIGGSTVDNGFEAAGAVDAALGQNLVLHLDGTYKDSSDYDIPGFAESEAFRAAEAAEEAEGEGEEEEEEEVFGTVENSAVETYSLTGGLSYVGDGGNFFGVAVHHFNSDYGVPGGHEEGEEEEGEGDEEEEEEIITIGLDQIRVDINGRINLDGLFEAVQVFGGYADYEHTEFEGDEIGTVFANEGGEIRLEAIQRERDGWAAAYGLQYRTRDFSAIGEEAFVPPTTTNQFGIYTFQEKEIGNVHLEGAARFESTSQENSVTGEDRDFDLFSVSVGGDIHVSESVRIGGTVFRTERAPTTEELFSDGPHLATSQFEIGDANLGKETATGIEAAFRYRDDGHFLTLNLFYTDYDDYIFERETGEIEDGLDVFQFTGEDASFRGFEVQGGADIGRIGIFDVSADGLLEFVRAETDSGNLPRIPPLSILAGIEGKTDQLTLRAELDYTDGQNRLADFETATEDFTFVNVFGTWRADVGSQNVALRLSVHNLFDTEGRQHSSFLKDLIPLPGRNVRASISTKF